MKKLQFIGMSFVAMTLVSCGPSLPQLGKNTIDEVIAAMTLEEKARLVIGTGMEGTSGDSAIVGETKGLVPGAAGTTYPIPRLGIPGIVLADGRPDFVYLLPVTMIRLLIIVRISPLVRCLLLLGTRNS